ncbi:MAG: ABC transporter ATP-binding protein [Candidatus Methanoplasma sp.]|jgi:ABC-type Fe3+/spermidine/putrescine transport system ATPase subunit|nr:ABC transporter ATP-binding protein [Candidatus Methanoplasma sp.]
MPEIVLENLVKEYGKCRAADGLSLTVNEGEYLCILGPTGSGKTTCLRMICGLTHPDSGRILFNGKDVEGMPVSGRKATMLSQVYSLFPPKTVYENVMFAPEIKEWPEDDAKQIVKSMIKMVHMENKAHSYPHELSGGQQQRTALARALASDSEILLLDEPLRALDARLRLELRKELKSLVKEMGLTSIHVTHDQDEALEMADRIAIIRKGRIVQVGTPKEVFQDPKTPFVANFVGRSNIFVGKVTESDGTDSEIEISIKEKGPIRIRARKTEFPIGAEAVVAVKIGSTRMDKLKESTEDEPDPEQPKGYFEGIVERILYEGATITIEAATDAGIVSAKLPNRRFDDYKVGDKVAVRWSPEMAVVFDVPSGGLEEELRLD